MSTENTIDTSSAGGTSTTNTSSSADTTPSTPSSTPSTSSAAPSTPNSLESTPNQFKGTAEANPGAVDPTKPVIAAPAYVPNFKYKAAQQEKELDPFFHSLIKDADSEKKVKGLFSKADAFEYIKERYDAREKEYNSLQTDYQAQSTVVQRVNEAKAKGDLDTVFRNVGLNDHQIIQWAAKRVDYLQMMQSLPPEQRQALQQQEQAALQNQTYQEQMSQMQSDLASQKVQNRTIMLEQSLLRPEVSQAASFWDNKMGQPGAFKDMVIEEAQKEWYMNQVDLPADQAVQRVMAKFGKFIDVQHAGPQDPSANQFQPQAPQMPQQKPVIPAIPGSSKTPIRKQIRTIADIKARQKELENSP